MNTTTIVFLATVIPLAIAFSLVWFLDTKHRWPRALGNFHAKRRFNKFGHVLGEFDFKLHEIRDIFDEPKEYHIIAPFESIKPLEIRAGLAGLLGESLNHINARCSSGRHTTYTASAFGGPTGVSYSYSVTLQIDPFILPYIQTYVNLKS